MKKRIIFLVGLIGLVLPLGVKADEITTSLNCNKTNVKASEEISCTIKVNTTKKINSVDMKIDLGSDLTFIDFIKDTSWEGDEGETWIALYTSENKSGEVNVGTFKVKASNNVNGVSTSISLKEIEITFEDFTDQKFSDVTQNIRMVSTINTLENIKIDNVAVTGFSKDKTSYDITVASDKTSVTISADKTNTSSTVSGDIGTKTLNYGINTFNINVTSESGTSKTYTLKVNRPDNRSGEKYILNFEFKGLDIGFDKSITKYNTKIENKYQKLAFCVGNYKIDTPNILCINSGAISISDKARDEVYIYNSVDLDKMYDEIYTKGEEKCNDEETECSYIYNGKEYIKVYYDTATDEEFGYFIVGDLKEGSNQLVITIKAENETTQDYTFTLNRLNAKGEDVSGGITNPDTNTSSYILITFVLLGAGVIIYKKRKNSIYE